MIKKLKEKLIRYLIKENQNLIHQLFFENITKTVTCYVFQAFHTKIKTKYLNEFVYLIDKEYYGANLDKKIFIISDKIIAQKIFIRSISMNEENIKEELITYLSKYDKSIVIEVLEKLIIKNNIEENSKGIFINKNIKKEYIDHFVEAFQNHPNYDTLVDLFDETSYTVINLFHETNPEFFED